MHGNRQKYKNCCRVGYEQRKKWNSKEFHELRGRKDSGGPVGPFRMGEMESGKEMGEATPSGWNGLGKANPMELTQAAGNMGAGLRSSGLGLLTDSRLMSREMTAEAVQ